MGNIKRPTGQDSIRLFILTLLLILLLISLSLNLLNDDAIKLGLLGWIGECVRYFFGGGNKPDKI